MIHAILDELQSRFVTSGQVKFQQAKLRYLPGVLQMKCCLRFPAQQTSFSKLCAASHDASQFVCMTLCILNTADNKGSLQGPTIRSRLHLHADQIMMSLYSIKEQAVPPKNSQNHCHPSQAQSLDMKGQCMQVLPDTFQLSGGMTSNDQAHTHLEPQRRDASMPFADDINRSHNQRSGLSR